MQRYEGVLEHSIFRRIAGNSEEKTGLCEGGKSENSDNPAVGLWALEEQNLIRGQGVTIKKVSSGQPAQSYFLV